MGDPNKKHTFYVGVPIVLQMWVDADDEDDAAKIAQRVAQSFSDCPGIYCDSKPSGVGDGHVSGHFWGVSDYDFKNMDLPKEVGLLALQHPSGTTIKREDMDIEQSSED